MTTSSVDGTVEQTDLKTARAGIAIFNTIRFRLDDGSEQVVAKAVTAKAVADELVPGAKGRFYIFRAFDMGGVHGVRTPDGRAVYGYPGNNQRIFLICGIVAIFWTAVTIVSRGGVPVLAFAMMILAVAGYYLTNKVRRKPNHSSMAMRDSRPADELMQEAGGQMNTGTMKIRWWRVLLGGFLIELALMLVAVVLFSALADPTRVLNLAIPPATLVAAVPIAAWVARSGPRPQLVGTLTGLAALLLYALIAIAGVLAAPERANLDQTLGPAYLASDALKVIGGAIGGWWVARRRLTGA